MTENEAKQKLDSLHYKIVHTSFCNKVYESEIEALCMAIKALEKQIPKKPTYAGKFGDLYVGSCSVCNDGVNSRMNYCDKCGQKLDWEGGE